MSEHLYGKVHTYSKQREIGVVPAIRLILSEFFRNKSNSMNIKDEFPDGIVDLGEGKGFVIDMERLRDKDGIPHPPPSHLTKEQTLEWIRTYYNGKKDKP